MAFIVVYDANALYPNTLRDLLIRIAQQPHRPAHTSYTVHTAGNRTCQPHRHRQLKIFSDLGQSPDHSIEHARQCARTAFPLLTCRKVTRQRPRTHHGRARYNSFAPKNLHACQRHPDLSRLHHCPNGKNTDAYSLPAATHPARHPQRTHHL